MATTRLPILARNFLSHQLLKGARRRTDSWARCLQSSTQLDAATSIRMPALSPTMQEGTIVKWYKKEGDPIAPGDILCDIQTDKAVVSFEIEEEGILAKILKPSDSKDVKIGTVIGVMVEEGEDWQNAEVPADSDDIPRTEPSTATETEAPAPSAASGLLKRLGYGPAVRSLLELYQLKIDTIPATGPHGRVLKGDVLKFIKDKGLRPAPVLEVPVPVQPAAIPPKPTVAAAPAPDQVKKAPPPVKTDGYSDLELTSMRKTIAKRLTESKVTIPHAYSAVECNVQNVLKMRKDLKADGVKVSVNDFVIKATAVALQRVPEVNAGWIDGSTKQFSSIDVSVAVATDSGLITPIVKDAIGKGIQEISMEVTELAGRARQGKLKLDEFQGGSFTISNLGMFGISEFTAVINPPQACILAVGTSRVGPGSDGHPQTMMTVTLSSDARVVDDTLAAQFLAVFKEVIENPMLMLGQPRLSSKYDEDMEEKLEKLFAK